MTLCHYCGYEQPPPDLCPKCGQMQVRYQGLGTEKLQAEIEDKFSGYVEWPATAFADASTPISIGVIGYCGYCMSSGPRNPPR